MRLKFCGRLPMSSDTDESLKVVVREKLRKKGVVEQIDHRIKVGMVAAIGELRGQKNVGGVFDALGFNKAPIEIKALHAIYAFLEKVGLSWTRECFISETQVQPEHSAFDLVQLTLGADEGTGSDPPAFGAEEEEEEDFNEQ
jgi:hypothetical protein